MLYYDEMNYADARPVLYDARDTWARRTSRRVGATRQVRLTCTMWFHRVVPSDAGIKSS